jgi:hypothetical protein
MSKLNEAAARSLGEADTLVFCVALSQPYVSIKYNASFFRVEEQDKKPAGGNSKFSLSGRFL